MAGAELFEDYCGKGRRGRAEPDIENGNIDTSIDTGTDDLQRG